MTLSNHKGTLYPDVSDIHYHLDLDNLPSLTREIIAHHKVYHLRTEAFHQACLHQPWLENWRQGIQITVGKAAIQAARRAFVAMKRPGHTDSGMVLIAAVGPFWMWCLATSVQIFGTFPGHT
jgi:sulfate adenylyltransferase subunit 1 (EFTu-like GTPase family)